MLEMISSNSTPYHHLWYNIGMKILLAEFTNFKGLSKVCDTYGVFTLDLTGGNSNIVNITGENGLGKSTLIANLNPFVMPNGQSKGKMETFISLPGMKRVEFALGEKKYCSVIEYKESGAVQAKLYFNDTLVEGYESGKATVYTDLIEKLLRTTQKTTSQVNYIGQNTNAIIAAPSKDRRALLEPLIGDVTRVKELQDEYEDREKGFKMKIAAHKELVLSLESQIVDVDIDSLADKASVFVSKGGVDRVGWEIDTASKRMVDKRTALRICIGKRDKIRALIQRAEIIKADQGGTTGFPKDISIDEVSGLERLVDLKKLKSAQELQNIENEESRKRYEAFIIKLEAEIESKVMANEMLLDYYGVEVLTGAPNTSKTMSQLREDKSKKEVKLQRARKDDNDFKINSEKLKQIKSLDAEMKNLGRPDLNRGQYEGNIKVRDKRIFELGLAVDDKIIKLVGYLHGYIDKSNIPEVVEHIGKLFGASGVGLDDSVRAKMIVGLELENKQDNGLVNTCIQIDSVESNISMIRAGLKEGVSSQSAQITEMEKELEGILVEVEGLKVIEKTRKDIEIYKGNIEFINSTPDRIKNGNQELAGLKILDIRIIDTQIELRQEADKAIELNKKRKEYRDIMAGLLKEDDYEGICVETETSIARLNTNINNLLKEKESGQQKLNVLMVENEKRDGAEKILKSIGDKKIELSGLLSDLKVMNAMKLYAKGIKDSVLASFMVNVASLANEYLASNELSSIKMALSIEQKGANFNIYAKQEGVDKQEINTLSGAESSTVNRALAMAIAFSNKSSRYGVYAFDESDSALSDSNKVAFIDNIKYISDADPVDQLFVISHSREVIESLDSIRVDLVHFGANRG